MNTISFFDFDGTITSKDSLLDFIKYSVGMPSFYFGLLVMSPYIIAYLFNIIPNHVAKEKLISYFFKGWEISRFNHIANNYSLNQIDKITRPEAIKRINWHKQKGHKVVIVSASIESWLIGWCHTHDLELISTRLEIENDLLTGRFESINCHGIEKVRRIKEQFTLSDYDYIFAYGDSSGDKELLEIASEPSYKPFRS